MHGGAAYDTIQQNKVFQKVNSCKNAWTHAVELFILAVETIWKMEDAANVKNGITKNVNKFIKVYLIKAIKNGFVHIVRIHCIS